MTIKEQTIAEYGELTTVNQWYICQCPLFKFKRVKGYVEPELQMEWYPRGSWFKCLIDDIQLIKGYCIGHVKYPFEKATLEEIKNHKFKDEL